MYSSDLNDAEWAVIEPFVTKQKSVGRRSVVDRRTIVNAILYQSRTGCQWRMLPKDFPSYKTVTHYYYRWLYNGTWERLHDSLVSMSRAQGGKKR